MAAAEAGGVDEVEEPQHLSQRVLGFGLGPDLPSLISDIPIPEQHRQQCPEAKTNGNLR